MKNKSFASMFITVVLAAAMVVPVFADDVHVDGVDITDNDGSPLSWTTTPDEAQVFVAKSGDEYTINGYQGVSEGVSIQYVVDSSTAVAVNGSGAAYQGSRTESGEGYSVVYCTFKAGASSDEKKEESSSSSDESPKEPPVDPVTAAINSSFSMKTAAGTDSLGTDAALVAEEPGPAAEAAFANAMPAGFAKGFSFSIVNGGKNTYSVKSGKLSFKIPAQFNKAGRKFKLLAIDKNGKVKTFENVSTEDGSFAADIDVEGYSFELVYAD